MIFAKNMSDTKLLSKLELIFLVFDYNVFSHKLMIRESIKNPITKLWSLFQLQSNPLYDVRSRWHNIVIPDLNVREDSKAVDLLRPFTKDHQQSTLKQGGSYIFFALEPNTKYEVRIQARNSHGWGRFSEEFLFSTGSTGIGIFWWKSKNPCFHLKVTFQKSFLSRFTVMACQVRVYFEFWIVLIQRLKTNKISDVTLMS